MSVMEIRNKMEKVMRDLEGQAQRVDMEYEDARKANASRWKLDSAWAKQSYVSGRMHQLEDDIDLLAKNGTLSAVEWESHVDVTLDLKVEEAGWSPDRGEGDKQ